MATVEYIRPKDTPRVTSVADADAYIVDGAIGVRSVAATDVQADIAAAFVAAPGTYNLATLTAGKVTTSQLPSAFLGSISYLGGVAGNAVPNTSTSAGDYYVITSAGTSQTKTWAVGDTAIYNGSSGSWTQLTPGTLAVAQGGTGGATAALARTNLDVFSKGDAMGKTWVMKGGLNLSQSSAMAHTIRTEVADSVTALGLGTDDFSIRLRFYRNSSNCWLVGSANESVVGLYFYGSGLTLEIGSGPSAMKSCSFVNAAALIPVGTTCEIAVTVDRISGASGTTQGTAKCYVNGSLTDTVVLGDAPTTLTSTTSIAGSGIFYVGYGWTAYYMTGSIYDFQLFNCLLSASDVSDMFIQGIHPKFRNATIAIYNKATFASDTDSWLDSGGGSSISTLTHNQTVNSSSGWMKVERTASGAGEAYIYRVLNTLQPGKRYRLKITIWNPTESTIPYFNINLGGGIPDDYGSVAAPSGVSGIEVSATFHITNTTSTVLRIYPCSDANGTKWASVPSNTIYYVKSIVVEQVGTLVDWDTMTNVGWQVINKANASKFHGSITGAGIGWVQNDKLDGMLFAIGITAAAAIPASSAFALPKDYKVYKVIVKNTTANQVSGFKLGTTAGASDVVSATDVAGNTTLEMTVSILQATENKQLFVSAGSWNSGSLNVTVKYEKCC